MDGHCVCRKGRAEVLEGPRPARNKYWVKWDEVDGTAWEKSFLPLHKLWAWKVEDYVFVMIVFVLIIIARLARIKIM